MEKILFIIEDKKTQTCEQVYSAVNASTLKRDLHHVVNANHENNLQKYPEDFEVYQVGFLDTNKGTITEHRQFLFNLSTLKES